MPQHTTCENRRLLIDIRSVGKQKQAGSLISRCAGPLHSLLRLDKINAVYQKLPPALAPEDFCRQSLEALNITYAVTEQELSRIPSRGPLVVVANHPFGGIEGVILAELLLQTRPDIRILGNYLLGRIPELAPSIIAVDPFNPRKAAAANAAALKQAVRWLKQGGALLTFPAGEVSSIRPASRRIADPPWSPHIGRLIRMARAKALPVYVHGRNSLMFNLLGLVHPRLRTALLPREVVNKSTSTIELSIGTPILPQKICNCRDEQEMTAFLRFSTYLLKHRKCRLPAQRPAAVLRSRKQRPQSVIAPVAKRLLQNEIRSLPERNRLVSQKGFEVYWTTAGQAPYIMREIARLREISFRDVGEGTGKSMDMDAFDRYYRQLFLWNTETQEIVGAYRMGCTDRILDAHGPEGLYTNTLFAFKPAFLQRLRNSLELGRSFIRAEYQKKFGCLAILWRGIGAYVALFPQYRYLFGPVSISQDYHTLSKNLMVEFLRRNSMDSALASLVRPRCAIRRRVASRNDKIRSLPRQAGIEDVSMMVAELEEDHKGVPTLVKHYLKLNGKFLGFNLDKDFGNVIDGLVLVDLLKTDPKIIQRFLGDEGKQRFYAFHGEPKRVAA